MKKYFTILVTLFSFYSVHAQDNVNKLFKLTLNLIERRVAIDKRGTDTSYFLDYSIENISDDTLVYITNSCFYYNHYSLKSEQQEFNLNAEGNCQVNALTHHTLAPGEFFNMSEWITATELNLLETGEWNMSLQVPLVKDERGYRVDGRDLVENGQYLTFNGEIIVVQILEINRKKKKTHSKR